MDQENGYFSSIFNLDAFSPVTPANQNNELPPVREPPPPCLTNLLPTILTETETHFSESKKRYETIIDFLKGAKTLNELENIKNDINDLDYKITKHIDDNIVGKDIIELNKLKKILWPTLEYTKFLIDSIYDNEKPNMTLFIYSNMCIENKSYVSLKSTKKRKTNNEDDIPKNENRNRSRILIVNVVTNLQVAACIKSCFEHGRKIYVKAILIANDQTTGNEICQRELQYKLNNSIWNEFIANFSDIELKGTRQKFFRSRGKVYIKFIVLVPFYNGTEWVEKQVEAQTEIFTVMTNESQYQQCFDELICSAIIRSNHYESEFRTMNFYQERFLESISDKRMRALTDTELLYLMNEGRVFITKNKNVLNYTCFAKIVCNFRYKRSKIFDIFCDGYIGFISKETAADILADKPIGTFVLRFSESSAKDDEFRIATAFVNCHNQIAHKRLNEPFTNEGSETEDIENDKQTRKRKIDIRDGFNMSFSNFINDSRLVYIAQIYPNTTIINKVEFLEKIFQLPKIKKPEYSSVYIN